MGTAIQEFVDKDEKDAIEQLINHQLEKTQRHLQARGVATEQDIDAEVRGRRGGSRAAFAGEGSRHGQRSRCFLSNCQILRFRDSKKNTMEEEKEIREVSRSARNLMTTRRSRQQAFDVYLSHSQLMDRTKAHRLDRGDQPSDVAMLDELADAAMDSDEGPSASPPPARGRGRGGRGRGSRGRGRGETPSPGSQSPGTHSIKPTETKAQLSVAVKVSQRRQHILRFE